MIVEEVKELLNMDNENNTIRIGLASEEMKKLKKDLSNKKDNLSICFDKKDLDHLDLIDQYLLIGDEEKYSSSILYDAYFTYLMYKVLLDKVKKTELSKDELKEILNIIMSDDLSKISNLILNAEFIIQKYFLLRDLSSSIKQISIFLEEDNLILQKILNSFINNKSKYKIDLYTTSNKLSTYEDRDGDLLRNCVIYELKPLNKFLRKISKLRNK